MHLPSLRANSLWVVKLLIGNPFTYKVNVTNTFDPKINRSHLLVMNNHHTKFEVPRPKCSLVIDRKPFFTYKVNLTLTSWPQNH
jgi:hypothetical protein